MIGNGLRLQPVAALPGLKCSTATRFPQYGAQPPDMSLHSVGLRKRGITPDSFKQFLPWHLSGATPAKMKQHLRLHGCEAMFSACSTSDACLAVVEYGAPNSIAPEPIPAFQYGGLDSGRKLAGANRKFDCIAIRTRSAAPDAEHRKRGPGMVSVSEGVHQRRVRRRAVRHGARSAAAVHGRKAGCIVQLLDQGFAENTIGERDPYTTSCRHTQPVAIRRGRVNGLQLPE